MAGIKPEAAKAQYYAGSPEQAFHLSRPCRFPAAAEPGKTRFQQKGKRAKLNFKANKYDHGLQKLNHIPNHKKCKMTRVENALCGPHCLKSERDEINASARLRSCLSDEPPSESHSALFHMSTPQGTPAPPALCKAHQKTTSF